MKKTYRKLFSEIFDSVVKQTSDSDNFLRQQASYLWTEIVGPGVNRYTSRRYVDDMGVFHVYITSAPLKNELSFHRETIRQKLNTLVGKDVINDIQLH
ncbi:MAG: DUF721 domain-containing protein [Muribaculaceae bacterium]|nr:DUF721 domain-containing protein [Muribaculaceae bacterium]